MRPLGNTTLAKKIAVVLNLPKTGKLLSVILLVAGLISSSLIVMRLSLSDDNRLITKNTEQSSAAGLESTSPHGWLGANVQDLTPELVLALGLKETRGALVAGVAPDSPATQAGLLHGDAIIGFNERHVQTANDLNTMVAETAPKTTVQLKILRRGNIHTVQVTLGHASETVNKQTTSLSPDEVERRLGIVVEQKQQDVVVKKIISNSPASQSDLQQGDVIREVNQTAVKTLEAYHMATSTLRINQPNLFLIERSGGPLYITIKYDELEKPLASIESHASLTEADVQQFLNTMATVFNQKGVDGIIQYFAPEASVNMTIITPIGDQTMNFPREEFHKYLTNIPLLKDWTSKQIYSEIQISPDGQQATMKSSSEGKFEFAWIKTPYRAESVIHFSRFQNTLAISSIQSTAHLESLGGIENILPRLR
jgi:hypothetical protein